jgi:hypothetical protein
MAPDMMVTHAEEYMQSGDFARSAEDVDQRYAQLAVKTDPNLSTCLNLKHQFLTLRK